MKKIIFPLFFACISQNILSQGIALKKGDWVKEISIGHYVLYPEDVRFPFLSATIRKMVTQHVQVGAGAGIMQLAYHNIWYKPVYTDVKGYFGKRQRFGYAGQAGFGFVNKAENFPYAWGPGKVIVSDKSSSYFSAGVHYTFLMFFKRFTISSNYVVPSTKHKIYIEATDKTTNSVSKYKGIDLRLAIQL